MYIEFFIPGHESFPPIAIYDEVVTLHGRLLAEPFPTFSRAGAVASILTFLDMREQCCFEFGRHEGRTTTSRVMERRKRCCLQAGL
jgi:hypothetical protein